MPVQTVLYSIEGGYRKSGSDWFSVEARDAKGLPVQTRVIRHASPTLTESKDDLESSLQRFTLETACDEECGLSFHTSIQDEAEVKLGGGQKTPMTLRIGQGEMVIDGIASRPNPVYGMLKSQKRALNIRQFVLANYRMVFLPVAIVGAAAFLLGSFFYWRSMFTNVCYIMAATSWVLVLSRAGLLILIDATAMPTLQWLYLSAAYPLLVCAAMFSIAALPQLACEPQPAK